MKRFCTASFLFVLALGVSARTFRHEFGTIAEHGGVAEHKFVLPAVNKPQAIANAFCGCPCLKVSYDKSGASKGKPLEVLLKYDPAKQQGHFTKSVYLKLDDGRRDTLVVTGTVKRTRPRIDTTGFTSHFGMGLLIDREVIDFGVVAPGKTKTLRVPVLNSYEAGMGLDLVPGGENAGLFTVPYGKRLGPGQKGEVEVRVSIPAGMKAGIYTAKLLARVNQFEIEPIPLKVRVNGK